MPFRSLPETVNGRLKALEIAKERKDAVPAPLIIPFTANTITRLDTFYPIYKQKVEDMEDALVTQTNITALVKTSRVDAEIHISHFYQALQNGIRRGVFSASVRGWYGLDVNDGAAPVLNSEADITFWHNKAKAGEAARIAAGGTAIPFPTIGEVNTAVDAFKNNNQLQANAKDAYDVAQEAVDALNPEADKLILKMWNEIETAFDEGDKPSMRRKAREWGVVYDITPGEQLNPAEFSITGKVTDLATGNKIQEVVVRLDENNFITITDQNGNYYVPLQPPGIYTVQAVKNGYDVKEITGVIVTAGEIITLNMQLSVAAPVSTGTISGQTTANNSGSPATVGVVNTTIVTTSDSFGNYTLENVPAGNHVISAALVSNPAAIVTQNVTVVAGQTITANFNFG